MEAEKNTIDANAVGGISEAKVDAPPTLADPASGSIVEASGAPAADAMLKPTPSADNTSGGHATRIAIDRRTNVRDSPRRSSQRSDRDACV